MAHLYELAKNHQEAFNTLSEMELPAEAINDTLEGLSGEVRDKCRSVAMWRENQLLIVKAKKELAKKIDAEAKSMELAANKMLDYLDFNMRLCGITEIDCEYFKIKYRNNPPSVEVTDPDLVPVDFIKTTTKESINLSEIKKEINAGRSVPGAQLVRGKTLQIK
jgi:hypothetical protein